MHLVVLFWGGRTRNAAARGYTYTPKTILQKLGGQNKQDVEKYIEKDIHRRWRRITTAGATSNNQSQRTTTRNTNNHNKQQTNNLPSPTTLKPSFCQPRPYVHLVDWANDGIIGSLWQGYAGDSPAVKSRVELKRSWRISNKSYIDCITVH